MEQNNSSFAEHGGAKEPTQFEVLLLAGPCYLLNVVLITSLGNYRSVVNAFGDNQPYVTIATVIRHWDFASLHAWQFWGLPYAMVAFSTLSHSSFWAALLFISAGSIAAVAIANRLWGGWVAGFFAMASREWMERTLLGGAEPLFLALVFGSFLEARKRRWLLAAVLASLSTIVGPMGIFALAGIALVLLFRKEYETLCIATLIGIVVGVLYALPLKVYFGSTAANVSAYGQAHGSGGKPLTYPFFASIHDALYVQTTKLNFARTSLWIATVLLSLVAVFYNCKLREIVRKFRVEFVFFGLYLTLLFTYNSHWARAEFPRYAIPVIPFLILAFEPWIRKDRRLLWTFGVGSAVLAAASTIGIVNFAGMLRSAL
jgi:hypothetical protein